MTLPVTRFAPSPTGFLHLGHAYAAIFAESRAREGGGRFRLRIEDIDAGRVRPEFTAAIFEDLGWLGLVWEAPVRHQSAHLDEYRAALDRLAGLGVVYPCFCTRKDIADEIARSPSAPHGPDGVIYPGLCRNLDERERRRRIEDGVPHAIRLDLTRALARIPEPLFFTDAAAGRMAAKPELLGDVVLARKDTPTSYHLACTVDDAIEGITLVTRGVDLFHATHVQRLLQALLGLPVPDYHHHPLLVDESGRRLAKRDRAATLRSLREAGVSPAEVRARLDRASLAANI